jgi:hypothetical protein
MIKKFLKDKFPALSRLYIKYLTARENYNYKYLCSLSEKIYPLELSKIYKKHTGQDLDWQNIRTYNEKMQWAKLYETNPLKTTLTDKYLVRNWIKNTIGEEYLIPLLGVWNLFDEIDFDKLPEKFVLKTNHGSGTNLIITDKNNLDINEAKKKFDKWMKKKFAFLNGFEMHYKNIEPKIIAEQYIETFDGDLKDYKFLCFGGEVYYCWVDSGRHLDHRRNVYNLNWDLQEWQLYYKNTDSAVAKPENFDLMIHLAKKLCQGFSHVRVDFYNVNGKVYFGEMTFTSESGFVSIQPSKYDLMLGGLWKLPIKSIK